MISRDKMKAFLTCCRFLCCIIAGFGVGFKNISFVVSGIIGVVMFLIIEMYYLKLKERYEVKNRFRI